MSEEKRVFAKRVVFNNNFINPVHFEQTGETMLQLTEKACLAFVNKWDETLEKMLYAKYQELGYTQVCLISEEEFDKFLRKYLPVYKKELEKENGI